MFHVVFFSSLLRSRYFVLFSLSFSFTLLSARTAKSAGSLFFFFLLTITKSGYLGEIKWFVCISKSQMGISFSRTDSGLCIYNLFIWSNLNFLHNSQWIAFPILLHVVLYSFCANLLYSLIMWLIISSLLPLWCLVYSCFGIVLMV